MSDQHVTDRPEPPQGPQKGVLSPGERVREGSPGLDARGPGPAAPGLTPVVTLAMAVAAGASAADVWYNQPMLGAMARDLGSSEHGIAAIPTATQLGFALGILLLLPVGDRMNRRKLIVLQLAGTAVAMAIAALSTNLALLTAASVLVGIGGSTAQQIIPFVAELASPETRGRKVGVVMSGLLSGVLLARVVSGAVADQLGWRAMYWLAAGVALVMAFGARAVLPTSRPSTNASYPALLRSLAGLARRHPALRKAALIQACLFGTISAFWSVLALLLEGPEYGLGATAAGLFGLVGVAGILAAPLAGKVSDTRGPHGVIGLSIALMAASFVLFAAWPSLLGLVIGVVLVDLGAQAAMVSNQSIIYGLAPDARGRVTTIYMAVMFLGGAVGSAGAGVAWAIGGGGLGGWRAVCALCLVLAVAAWFVHRRRPGLDRRHGDRPGGGNRPDTGNNEVNSP